ncbi:putative glycoside hydrolase [Salisediminibacterium halotolerans]|uniref:DUF4015 domain-containing protein n=1 Tax=Salisediminibacterium halotolerans TaxID=517425 RepID=A0A1H9VE23_9BACI|nr:putative glycoside hydrolase [Salisediminibacterium haloalkalitolerans]SES19912.1 hypothetical protein SAMN05444126_12013 [Salisediminibacterium haloalkalitolerans]
MNKSIRMLSAAGMIVVGMSSIDYIAEAGDVEVRSASMHLEKHLGLSAREWPGSVGRFSFDSGYDFNYPDAVRGIFVTGHTAGGSRFDEMLDLVNDTALNSMVIDVKEDDGYVTFIPDEDEPFYEIARNWIADPDEMMAKLEDNDIYPIARVVAFKDTELAEKRPDLSFQENGEVWKNSRGEAFTNPFLKEVWDYNVDVAKKAAEMGFEDIQFDYVRFPEGFENMDEDLEYGTGDYEDSPENNVRRRVDAVTDFVEYAREELQEYDVDVSVDVFGYAITTEETPGIGQNFGRLAEAAEVMSSMIYPSHWTPHFGVDKPDLHPYEITDEYAQRENELLNSLDDQPTSRPWIQDFTASYLGEGNYQNYGVDEVEAQIQALYDNDIHEFLLWNASNNYTEGVDYMLDLDEEDLQ